MNRRLFLSSLLGAATLDPERLLWVPGRKLISIPTPKVDIAEEIAKMLGERISYAMDFGFRYGYYPNSEELNAFMISHPVKC